MGLFGRDERSPSPAAPAAPSPDRTVTRPQAAGAPSTMVSRPIKLDGSITGSGDVHVEGEIKGSVSIGGQLMVAESGMAKATLHARVVVVAGTVTGNVTADEKIELRPTARLRGDIVAPKILIHEGAMFEGQVVMKGSGKAESGAASAAAPSPATPPGPVAAAPSDRPVQQTVPPEKGAHGPAKGGRKA